MIAFLTGVAALAVLAVACGLTAVLVRRAGRRDTDRIWEDQDWAAGELEELYGQVGLLTRELTQLNGIVADHARTCGSWHDLVQVHRHAIDNVTARIKALEDAGRLPAVDTDSAPPLLFAQTFADVVLPRHPAIGTAAAYAPPDNTETGFTGEHVLALRAATGDRLVLDRPPGNRATRRLAKRKGGRRR